MSAPVLRDPWWERWSATTGIPVPELLKINHSHTHAHSGTKDELAARRALLKKRKT